MSTPTWWPEDHLFEPIGNTPAICLTRDIPPEAPADILLLNARDCRHILFTVHNELAQMRRKLDFTCSDTDPGIIARAAVLFTMILDGLPTQTIWNIFYHAKLDDDSLSLLVVHCRKLQGLMSTIPDWNRSTYGNLVRFGSEFTFLEVRRLISLYADNGGVPAPLDPDIEAVINKQKTTTQIFKFLYRNSTLARSAGPFHEDAEPVYQESNELFSRTGTTFTNEKEATLAKNINPTFYYSRHGPASILHPCLDPLPPFHTAPLFGDRQSGSVCVSALIGAARNEFDSWCDAFRAAAMPPSKVTRLVVRFILGDPLVVARALEGYQRGKSLNTRTPLAPWTMRPMVLSAEEYVHHSAPTAFNVIDVSTVWDVVGIFNVLPAVTPLLSVDPRCESVVIYLDSPRAKELFETVPVQFRQTMPCTMRVTLGSQVQDVFFPLPMNGVFTEVHLSSSREDLYIELHVPVMRMHHEEGGYSINPFPVIPTTNAVHPWSTHRVNLDRSPVVNPNALGLHQWLRDHIKTQYTILDTALQTRGRVSTKIWKLPKDAISHLFYRPFAARDAPVSTENPVRVIALCDETTSTRPGRNYDTILFMGDLRYDVGAHTVVADAHVLTMPLTPRLLGFIKDQQLGIGRVPLYANDVRVWKLLLPAMAERCRSWSHTPNCEYKTKGTIPLDTNLHGGDPLCSCGRGKDVEGMLQRRREWAPFAPYVTRIAIGLLFPVWYLEPMARKFLRMAGQVDSEGNVREQPKKPPQCTRCGDFWLGLKRCSRCHTVMYCSPKCQKEDWKRHKPHCRGPTIRN
ncbi:hypothetical protein C8Q76DRAFT_859847 [Earliella scabrosa]|nr:hypothetical protein C8Q76DRAFT_859847 [Earliella scabrosa]